MYYRTGITLTFFISCIITTLCARELLSDLSEADLIRCRKEIQAEFLHSWNGFLQYAGYKHDELRPVSNSYYDWMELSVSTISALDTLLIMDLKEEFAEAREWVEKNFHFEKDLNVSLFETNIRIVGGLLSAYELSKDNMFLDKAKTLGDRLVAAFTQHKLPYPSINLMTGKGSPTWGSHVTTLAEVGSLTLEFEALSYYLNDSKYALLARDIIDHLDMLDPPGGLYPMLYEIATGHHSRSHSYTVTFGSNSDSFYEYLLKYWIQSNKTEARFRELYEESLQGMIHFLLKESSPSKNLYIASVESGKIVDRMDHLSCFVPGMIALGAIGKNKKRDIKIAEALATTCFDMYSCTVSGLAPESMYFKSGFDFIIDDPKYLLRPETIESLFVLYRVTKNPIYRHRGWKIFKALERNCKTESGYSGILDVGLSDSPKDDRMQGYFFSETIKYLYLLFSDDEILPFSKYVFNTEAHPLPIIDRNIPLSKAN